jgi:hypothetical protein
VKVKQAKEKKEICMGKGTRIMHSHFFMEISFYMEFYGQQWSFECGSLEESILGMFGYCFGTIISWRKRLCSCE